MTQGPRIRITPIKPVGANVDGPAIRRQLVRMVRNTGADGKRFIAKYPAQRLTASGYVRTGTLKRSWSNTTRAGLTKIEGTVGSSDRIAPYNIWVQGPNKGTGKRQVLRFRAAGWQGVDDLSKMLQTRVEREADAIIERATRSAR